MSAPVDVLAVLDRAHVAFSGEQAAGIYAARAAVAELIEADEEYDAARREEHAAEEADDDELQCNAVRRMQWAKDRRAIALARCNGGAA